MIRIYLFVYPLYYKNILICGFNETLDQNNLWTELDSDHDNKCLPILV